MRYVVQVADERVAALTQRPAAGWQSPPLEPPSALCLAAILLDRPAEQLRLPEQGASYSTPIAGGRRKVSIRPEGAAGEMSGPGG